MQNQNLKQNLKQTVAQSKEEHILVVKREHLFTDGCWQGLVRPSDMGRDDDSFVETIFAKKEFLRRSVMETDFSYKQIIPYLVFTHDGKYFLMQRKAKASESRLKSKYSLGIGGHIRQEDIKNKNISDWAYREFHEEVDYTGTVDINFLGVLNDDSNDVGRVHIGFVYLLKGDSSHICVKEELQSGELYTSDECMHFYDRMEHWSKIVFDYLKQ